MAQSVPLPSVPKLSFGNGIIDLSDVPAVPRKATGIDALMDKFVKQVGPKTAVSNESAAPEQMDLHGSKLETKAKIGHKLVMLKQQLLGKIKQKRREEQLQREAAWREEHPEEVEEENVEEVEESEGEETTSESEEEEVEVEKSPLKLKNPFADDEESTAEVESDLGKNKEISNERPDDSFSGCNAALSGLDSQFLPVTQQPPVASLTRGPINFADLGFDDRSSREISPTANASFQQTDDLHLRLSLDTETLNCDDLSSTPTQPTTSSVPFTNVKQSLAALIDDHDDSSNSQSNQDLMQVCSGRFPTQTQQLPMQSSLDKVDEQLEDDSIEEETELEDEDEKEEGEESEIEGDQADIEDENGGDSSDEEMELVKQIRDRQSSSGVPKPMAPLINLTAKRKDRNAFFDTEAELSGSEAESDENEDGGSDLDEYEVEEGDLEELPPEEELKRQVQRIHNKRMLDEDNRRLMLIKEALLEDGDLHSDKNRLPRFRWRKAGENDTDGVIVDAEEDGGETAAELLEMEQLQKRRLELIQWQTEQQRDGEGADVGETVDSDESESYFFKTALKVVRQSTSMDVQSSQSSSEFSLFTSEPTQILQNSMEISVGPKDSLLKRDISLLSKLAKGAGIGVPTAQSLNKCVFTRVSPSKKHQSPRKKRKAAAVSPIKKTNEAKKLKPANQASIFNCF